MAEAGTAQANLEDAIALVALQARHQGVRLTRTKLVKLLYFVDLRAWESLARTITGVEWMWHHYGPYSSTIVEACNRMAANGELEVEERTGFAGNPEYLVRSVTDLYYDPPSEAVVGLVRGVVAEFGRLGAAQIGDRSYDTTPMKRLMQHGQRGDAIEFDSDPPQPRDVAATLARYAKLARQTQGTDEGDVAALLREEMAGLSHARRSAGSRMLAEP